jgi:saccharopine dehydrogenase (NAD+, L-lysine-forming)
MKKSFTVAIRSQGCYGLKRILVLGGYGGAGSSISRTLLGNTSVDLVVAGRRKEEAQRRSSELNQAFPGRVSSAYADASHKSSLISAFSDVDIVVVAATTTKHVETVARSALAAGIDYLDIHYPQEIVAALKALAPEIEGAGRCFITQAGFFPGLPSVLVRLAAPYFHKYRAARVGMAMNTQFETLDSVGEILDGMGEYEAKVFEKGKWRDAGLRDRLMMDLGPYFGTRAVYPTSLEEMRPLPDLLGLEELGLYVAGINWFVDYLVAPLAMMAAKVRKGWGKKTLSRMMIWGTKYFSPPGDAVAVVLEAFGDVGPRKVRMEVVSDDAYYLTSVVVVSCLMQYLEGSLAKPGLWMMGNFVDPKRLAQDMEGMGINIQIEVT